MRKTYRLLHLMLIGIFGGLLMAVPETNSIRLDLSFRILGGAAGIPEISQEAFKLMIDGEPVDILNLTRKQERLDSPSLLGRHFILSFQVDETSSSIVECFSYFVHQVLDPRDTLMVLTPLRGYQIRVRGNKERVVADIEKRLEDDTQQFRKDKNIAERNLITMINQLDAIMSDQTRSSGFNVQRFKEINRFLYVFPQEFHRFRDLFLLPHTGKYSQILKQFSTLEGERWWIHLQQRETSDLVSRTSRVVSRINDYYKEEASHFSRIVSHLDELLDLLQSFPVDQVLEPLVDYNFCYNVVIFGGMKESGNDSVHSKSSSPVGVMGDITRKCGGRTIAAVDPMEGLKQLVTHRNEYYELGFEFDGSGESLNFNLQGEDGALNLVYRKKMTAEEIDEQVRYRHSVKIRIEDLTVRERTLKFSIRSFEKDEKNSIGMIKVTVTLENQTPAPCFTSTRILRASDRTVTLSLNLPGKLAGNFLLTLQAIDLIANRMARTQIPILL